MVHVGKLRKERVHQTGKSNRSKDWNPMEGTEGAGQPIDFDGTMRSTAPQEFTYQMDVQVPITKHGHRNQDFEPMLPGQDFRRPGVKGYKGLEGTKRDQEKKEKEATMSSVSMTETIRDPNVLREFPPNAKKDPAKARGFKAPPRWNPNRWWQDPMYEQQPLRKEEGADSGAWNPNASQKTEPFKGQDRLFRSCPRPDGTATPSEDGGRHPLEFDAEEYYPEREMIDAIDDAPSNDWQVRPVNLPDFTVPPPPKNDDLSLKRMRRIREVLRTRYGGRPGLLQVFKNFARTKHGYIFPKDLTLVLDKMGVWVSEHETELLVNAVDKDQKGAMTFEEFADLVYSPQVNIGDKPEVAQERHIRHVTKTLVDMLIQRGPSLGKAFCEIDPERRYVIGKRQFANAICTACNHISNQAVDFLWAAQFPSKDESGQTRPPETYEKGTIDWRSFMSQLALFANEHRVPTPCCVQGRKRQYDMLQRTAYLTGGKVAELDLNRPDQDTEDDVLLVADKIVHRERKLANLPHEAIFKTPNYVDYIHTKADRCERALGDLIPRERMEYLLKNQDGHVQREDLIEVIMQELDKPGTQDALRTKPAPPWKITGTGGGAGGSGEVNILSLEGESAGWPNDDTTSGGVALEANAAPAASEPAGGGGLGPSGAISALTYGPAVGEPKGTQAPPPGGKGEGRPAAYLRLERADVQAMVGCEHVNKVGEVDVEEFLFHLYRTDDKKAIEEELDGLNPAIRLKRPPRERPADSAEEPRYANYWQARYMMELLADNMAAKEVSNGGKLKSSKIFKRLDMDGDGYVTVTDLQKACEHYKVLNTNPDLHALFSALDPEDKGSVDIGQFTRNFKVHQGSLLDNLQKPIIGVFPDGGVAYGGPVVQRQVQSEMELARLESLPRGHPDLPPPDTDTSPGPKSPIQKKIELKAKHAAELAAEESQGKAEQEPSGSPSKPPAGDTLPALSDRTASGPLGRAGRNVIGVNETPRDSLNSTAPCRITDVLRARTEVWKPHKSELYTTLPPGRFSYTIYPDTRHVTQPMIELGRNASYLSNAERFKTTNSVSNMYSVPDYHTPQQADEMRKNAQREYRVERIRQRQREFTERCAVANEAGREFEEKRIARKALNQLNYERRVRMACT